MINDKEGEINSYNTKNGKFGFIVWPKQGLMEIK